MNLMSSHLIHTTIGRPTESIISENMASPSKLFRIALICQICFVRCFGADFGGNNSTFGRYYRGTVLENGLKVILISDPETTEAAATLHVEIGSMDDPKSLQGLAHFVEHLVFLGNMKYPEPDGFSKFISENGGIDGATTGLDYTQYYFTILPKAFPQALDQFAQMISFPLLTNSSIEAEVSVVNAEHEINIPSDPRRYGQIEMTTAQSNHSYNHFNTGNRDTLWDKPREMGIDVFQAVKDFHERYYSADIMTLALLSPQSLDELEKLVEETFTQILNRNTSLPTATESPYSKEQLGTKLEMVAISEVQEIIMAFPIPTDSWTKYYTKLINQEGPGSLESLLKSKNLGTSVSSVVSVEYRNFRLFQVTIVLTEEGVKNYEDAITYFYQYIKMLRDTGPQQWYWDELQDMDTISSRFALKSLPKSHVSSISYDMMESSIDAVINSTIHKTNLTEEFDLYREKLVATLNSIVPSNMRLTIISKTFQNKTKLVEPYYKINYNYDKIDPQFMKKLEQVGPNDALSFPPKNKFIPKSFEMKSNVTNLHTVPNSVSVPIIINETDLSKVWFLQDDEFLLPVGLIFLELYSPITYVNPLAKALNHIFVNMVINSLSEYSYSASEAGINFWVQTSFYGIQVEVSGYNDGIQKILDKVMLSIANFNTSDLILFERIKNKYKNTLLEDRNWQPCALPNINDIFYQQRWSSDDVLDSFEDVTMENLISFYKSFMSRLRFQWLFYGNLTPEEAVNISSISQSYFTSRGTKPLPKSSFIRPREIEIPEGSNWVLKTSTKTHTTSCTRVLFQSFNANLHKSKALIELLVNFAYLPMYNQLRTKEQLGYNTAAQLGRSDNSGGLVFEIYVQGESPPSFVEGRIDSFLNQFTHSLKNITQEEFLLRRNAYFDSVLGETKPSTLYQSGWSYFSEIVGEHYQFDRREKELEALRSISLLEFDQFVHEFLGLNSSKQRRLSLHIISRLGSASIKHKQRSLRNLNITNDIDEPDMEKVYREVQEEPKNGTIEILDLGTWKKKLKLLPLLPL